MGVVKPYSNKGTRCRPMAEETGRYKRMRKRLLLVLAAVAGLALWSFASSQAATAQAAPSVTISPERQCPDDADTVVITGHVTGSSATQGVLRITIGSDFADYIVAIDGSGNFTTQDSGYSTDAFGFDWTFTVLGSPSQQIGSGHIDVPVCDSEPPTTEPPTTAPPTTAPPTTQPPTTAPPTTVPSTNPPTTVGSGVEGNTNTTSVPPSNELPRTGTHGGEMTIFGLGLVGAGTLLVVMAKRRRLRRA